MKNVIILVLVLLGCLGVAILINSLGKPDMAAEGGEPVPASTGLVYYFDGASEFGGQLNSFIKNHPELRIVSVAPLDNGIHGSTRGYWVVVEKR